MEHLPSATSPLRSHFKCPVCGFSPRKGVRTWPVYCCGVRYYENGDTEVCGGIGCRHRGEPTGSYVKRRTCATCSTKVAVYGCAVHGRCTIGASSSDVPCCLTCPDREQWRWVTTADLMRDAVALARSCKRGDIDAVVGVARSGMMPAAAIASALGLPLYAFDGCRAVYCGSGPRLQRSQPAAPRKALLVDDTVASGRQMRRAVDALSGWAAEIVRAAVYVNPQRQATADLWSELLPLPHLLEWHFFDSRHVKRSAFDIDGLLVGVGGKPLYLVGRKIPLIVTARLERDRERTENQLRDLGIRWGKLEMGPWSTAKERDRGGRVAEWKGERYAAAGLDWYLESEEGLAREIAGVAGLAVICPPAGRVFAY